jgi:hypothetical protein
MEMHPLSPLHRFTHLHGYSPVRQFLSLEPGPIDHHSPEKIGCFRQLAQFSGLQHRVYCSPSQQTGLSLRSHTSLVLVLCWFASEDTVQQLRVVVHDVKLPSITRCQLGSLQTSASLKRV